MKISKIIICCLIVITCQISIGCSEEGYLIDRGNREAEQENYESAIERFNMALEINSQNATTYFNRALVWSKMGKMDNAIDDYTKALELNKKFVEAYTNRGFVWNRKRNYDFAISDYSNALQLDPNNFSKTRIYFYRAATWFSRGDYDNAIDDYTESIKINPNNYEPYYSRAEAWYEKGDFDRAISDYTKAIQINPKYAQAVFNRANTWHEKREYASAIIDYEKAVELEPQNAHIYNNYSWLLSTCPDGKFRDGANALKLALKAVELNPDEAFFLDTLAAAYAELGDFKEAIKTVDKSILFLKQNNKENLKDELTPQLESYKAGKPWREDVKNKDSMRSYKIQKKE